ncbi:CHAT domain-containing protein [Amycolatopsis kentuckyensis]|uniref:CHAT domain-containing protein n=1 Tax=Amycolatopsis kentuckyensis TaxID=218823 RepID=UPI001ABFA740|nr:CHAT domain-containing protein [Amycolatopsis kentuckyensis]
MTAEDGPTPAELAILERVRRAGEGHDVLSWFLGPEAAAVADEVRAGALLPDGMVRRSAALAIAYHYWFRYLAGRGTEPMALADALLCFVVLREDSPDHVPPVLAPVLAVFSGEPADGDVEPGDAFEAATGLVMLYQTRRHPPILIGAERLLRYVLAGLPPADVDRGTCLSTLGLARLYAFHDGAGHDTLAEAVGHCRAAVAAAPGEQAEQARRHGNLGIVLRHWSDATSDVETMRESLAELRLAVRMGTADQPNHAGHCAALGSALGRAAGLLQDPAILPEAIDVLRQALATRDPDVPPPAAHLAELATVLVMHAVANDRPELYGEGIDACRRAADTAPNPVERAAYLANLAMFLNGRWNLDGDPRGLDEAEAAARAAVGCVPPGHPSQVMANFILCGVLRSRHGVTGRLADLDEAIALARAALDATPTPDRGQRVARGTELAGLLRLRAVAVGTPDTLDEPIALLRDLEREVSEHSADRARVLFALARCLAHARRGGGEGIDRFRECLTLPHPSSTFEAEVRFAWGSALAQSAEAGDEDAWRQATDQMRQGLALLPPTDARRAEFLSDFGGITAQHALNTGDLAEYEEAVCLGREAVAHAPAGNTSEAAAYQSNLGAALVNLAHRIGDAALLAEAVQAHRTAVALSLADDHHRAHRIGNLGGALQRLAEVRADPGPLEEAIAVLREAVASTANIPGKAHCLASLGQVLRSFSRFTGDPAPLSEAVERHREAIAVQPATPSPAALLGLANSLADLYDHTGDDGLREEAVRLLRSARDLIPEASDDRAAVLTSLGHVEWARARDSGDHGRMDEALATLREAVAAAPAHHGSRSMALTNLGVGLLQRAQRSGDRTWHAEALTVLRRAVSEGSPTSFDRAGRLNNLAGALRGWYDIVEDPAAADEAADLLSEAASLTGGERVGAELTVLNVGLLLHSRAISSDEPGDAAAARQALEVAATRLREGHPQRAVALSTLASACLHHAQLVADGTEPVVREALRRAVAVAREALTCMRDDAADRAGALVILARAQVLRAELGEPVDLTETTRLVRQAAENPAAPLVIRLFAARTWGDAAARAGRDTDALDGYAYAVDLLPRIAPRSLGRADQEDRLRAGPGLAGDAAAFALRTGDPGRALVLLEQGRGVLLAQGLDNRGQVSRVRDIAPALADEFERIRDQLSVVPPPLPALWTDSSAPGLPAGGTSAGLSTEARHALARRWDELVAEIRGLPGLADFLRVPDLPELLAAAVEGPVVVVNVSSYRSDAIIVTADDGIVVVPLRDLAPGTVLSRAALFIECVEQAYGSHGVDSAVVAMGMLTETLRWLWDTVAAPVLDRLSLRTVPLDEPRTRLWWCPTGWLSFLPLHAAGRDGPDSGKWVVDRVLPSYTPTLRALLQARRHPTPGGRTVPAPLVVTLSETPGAEPLPGVDHEAETVLEIFPGGRHLSDAEATVAAVRRALPAHSWVHFGCHAVSDAHTSSASGLVLHDGRLTTLDVAAERPAHPQLAVLSACSTSRGGFALPDEAVQLASSFQLAGYPHVIGTLWAVADELSTYVIKEFYAALAQNLADGVPITPAAALHGPTRALRDRYAKAPHLWAAYVHTGP